ncbi:MAG TPA: SDR family NAD(P)-dependent oxidoreductase, partial [Hyphomicrobiaceae bacterium]|nr:SDR family NAD(P)-dependent oxidoreductase [Hyphomicrobiaceae bacterium]
MKSIEGQIALVTGAARGIGAAMALAYAREGASVVVTDLNEAGANEVAEQVRGLGVQADAFVVDVRDPAQSVAMVERVVKKFGRLDLMVNNAGVIRVKSFLNTTP